MDLLNMATATMKNAYAPYSNLKVGVALKSEKERYYVGCNVENAAYPQGLCAEAGAISAMVAGGCRSIAEILVYSDGNQLIVPCGGCRQKIREFSNENTIIYLAEPDGIKKELKLEDLLPFSFDQSFLNNGD